tara:strand:+ start:836 stop:1261 length:426 start_codon:yes stop_codon:yes gene_type:complete
MTRLLTTVFVTSLCSALFSPYPRSEGDVLRKDMESIRSISLNKGEQLFFVCESCHSLNEVGQGYKLGPNLYGILGRPAASREDYDFSEELKRSDIVWTRESLITWIVSTETMVPGTFMLYENFLNAQEVNSLVNYIIEKVE